MALKSLEGQNSGDIRLVHHSDRGVQYASKDYVSLLKAEEYLVSKQ